MGSIVFEVDFYRSQLVANTLGSQSSRETRCEIENPLHPARVYKALAAAHYVSPSPESELALRQLEELNPPRVHFPKVSYSNTVTSYSPIEEEITFKGHAKINFAKTAVPKAYGLFLGDHIAQYVWDGIPDDRVESLASELDQLCSRVWYLGTSDSLIAARVYAGLPTLVPNWIPHKDGKDKLRIPTPGYFKHLQHCYESRAHIDHTTDFRVGYRRQGVVGPRTESKREILAILRISPKLPLEALLTLSARFRAVLMGEVKDSFGDEAIPVEYLAGHTPDGGMVKRDHLALVPLVETGQYRDGSIAGVALISPKDVSSQPLIQSALDKVQTFLFPFDGSRVEITVNRVDMSGNRVLEASTWDEYSTIWASVTPVAVPYLGKNLTLAQSVAKMCEQDGLPPVTVEVSDLPFVRGHLPPASAIQHYQRKDGRKYLHCYVRLEFDHEVQGPIGLGAGKFQGYGWFRRVRGACL